MKPTFQRTFSELQRLIGEELDINPQRITPETRFAELGIDSLELAGLIIEFETWAGVEVEGNPRSILRVQQLMDIAEIP